MRLTIVVVTAALAMIAVAAPQPARAARCGNAAAYLQDVQTHGVTCAAGKRLAHAVWNRAGACVPVTRAASSCRVRGWTCRSRRGATEAYPFRCTRGPRWVRFRLVY
jgi:hypothetical protein